MLKEQLNRSGADVFDGRGEPTADYLDQLIEGGELSRYYGAYRRVRRVMGRDPTFEEVAWEQTQLNPFSPVSVEQVADWHGHHEILCSTFSNMITKTVEYHPTDLSGLLEQQLMNIVDRTLLLNAYSETPEGLKRYIGRTLQKAGLGFFSQTREKTIGSIEVIDEFQGDYVEEDRLRILSTPSKTHELEILERVTEFCSERGIPELTAENITIQYYQLGLVGTLKYVAELMEIDIDDVVDIDKDAISDVLQLPDGASVRRKKSRKNITIGEYGVNVAEGWSIEQVYSAIFRLPLEFKWVAMVLAGYFHDKEMIKDIYKKIGGRDYSAKIDRIPQMIQRRLIADSAFSFSLPAVLAELNRPEVTAEVYRRLDAMKMRESSIRYDFTLDLVYRIMRALDKVNALDLKSVHVSPRIKRSLVFIDESYGRDPSLHYTEMREHGRGQQVYQNLLRGAIAIVSQLEFSFPQAKQQVEIALKEGIADLTDLEKHYLKLHYGTDTGKPLSIDEIARLCNRRYTSIAYRISSACLKIMDRLYDLNGGVIVPLRPLRSIMVKEIVDPRHEQAYQTVHPTPLFQELPPHQRNVLIYYYDGGKPDRKSVAQKMRIKEKSVNSALFRARRKILPLNRKVEAVKKIIDENRLSDLGLNPIVVEDFMLSWGLKGDKPLTDEEIANHRGVTRRSVRRNIRKVVDKCVEA